MCDEETKALLREIADSLQSDDYESGGYWTVGGGAGTYVIKSPFNTECEWQLSSVCTTEGLNVGFAISPSNPTAPAPIKNSTVYGSLTTGGEGNAFEGVAGYIQGASPVTYLEWQPLGRGAYLYFITAVAAGDSMMATVAFRRKLARYIPDKPRQQPHTHTHPQSRIHQRKLAAQSTMVAGFEEQYPVEGGKPYSHADPRSVLQQGPSQQQLAPGQDTAVDKRGVFSLGRTNNVRRRR